MSEEGAAACASALVLHSRAEQPNAGVAFELLSAAILAVYCARPRCPPAIGLRVYPGAKIFERD